MKKVFVAFIIILSLSLLLLAGCTEQQLPPPQETPEPVVVDTSVEPEDVQTDASGIAAPEVPATPKCGDGVCNGAENCDMCIKDCGCVSPAECYQATCKVPECGSKGDCKDNDTCTIDECQFAQHPNAYCSHEVIDDFKNGDDCCPNKADANTDSDCEPVCGNNECEMGENSGNCEDDCPDEPEPVCGDQSCEGDEDRLNCPQDCS